MCVFLNLTAEKGNEQQIQRRLTFSSSSESAFRFHIQNQRGRSCGLHAETVSMSLAVCCFCFMSEGFSSPHVSSLQELQMNRVKASVENPEFESRLRF